VKQPVGSRPPGMWFAVPYEVVRNDPATQRVSDHSHVVTPGILAPLTFSQQEVRAGRSSGNPAKPAIALDPKPEATWTKKHVTQLRKAVANQSLRYQMRELHKKTQRETLRSGSRGKQATVAHEQESERLRNLSARDLEDLVPPDGGDVIDWYAVVLSFGCPQHSRANCRGAGTLSPASSELFRQIPGNKVCGVLLARTIRPSEPGLLFTQVWTVRYDHGCFVAARAC
jgi:hypothetical protein